MKLFARAPMSCQELVELLTEYLEDAMPKRRRLSLESHLMKCVNCTNYFEQFQATIALTGQLREEDVEPAAMDELLVAFRDWRG
jgi:anti-sigma factor RsiW